MSVLSSRRLAYLSLEATGEGRAPHAHVHEIISGLRARGWEVELFEPSCGNSPRRIPTWRKLLEYGRVQLRLWSRIRRIDVLYIRDHPGTVPSVAWARLFRIPVVQELNGPGDDLVMAVPWMKPFTRQVRALIRSGLTMGRTFVVGTEQLGQWLLEEAGPKRTHVIPNGANTRLFHPAASTSLRLPSTYAVFFGALAAWQGIETILDAFQHPSWPRDVELVIVGDGQVRGLVEGAAARNERIHYLGLQPYAEVPGIVARSLVSLAPKNYEIGKKVGLSPLKVYETLACGVPVVVSDLPGQVEVVREHDCGIVVPQRDPEAVANAVATLRADPVRRKAMGERGRAAVEREHSWDQRASLTHDALLELLQQGSERS